MTSVSSVTLTINTSLLFDVVPLIVISMPSLKPCFKNCLSLSRMRSLCSRPVASGSPSLKLIVFDVYDGSSSAIKSSFSNAVAVTLVVLPTAVISA